MLRIALALGILLTVGVAEAAPPLPPCRPVAGSESLLRPGSHIIVGEIHGTTATPQVVGDLVCHAAQRGPVRLGVEMTIDDQPALDAFVASAGTPADRRSLLTGHWDGGWQDGIHSAAMLELIESVRVLRRAGVDAGVVAFSHAKKPTPDRDLAMAENLAAAFARAPKATFIVLTGNLHARKLGARDTVFMAMRLVEKKLPVTTLDSRYALGSSWSCWSDSNGPDIDPGSVVCGPIVMGEGAAAPPGVELRADGKAGQDGAYDGVLVVGTPTYSPPAAVPMTKEQTGRAALLPRRLDAQRAYAAKSFAVCGELNAALAHETRSADEAYNAACCYARASKRDLAFTQLGAAIDFGFRGREALVQDEDLKSLHDDPRWGALQKRLSK